MKVVIAAPRKAGNAQLRCLLAAAYGLEAVGSRDTPDATDGAALAAWMRELPEGSIVHTGYAYSPELDALAAAHGVTFVAIVRHPYDLFVSNFEIAQRRAGSDKAAEGRFGTLGQPGERTLDDPAVLAYLKDGFAGEIAWLRGWQESGAPLVRFEDLEEDEAGTVSALAAGLGPLTAEQVARAVDTCAAPPVYRARPTRGRRMPAAPTGAWRDRLTEEHLAILRERYGEEIRRLGYEVY
jgi:hypothetical protein